MNLFNLKSYVKQMLAPKWRKVGWKLSIALVLLKPLESIYRLLLAFEKEVLYNMNITPQVMVLEDYLQRSTGISNRLLFLVDSAINGEVDIYLSSTKVNYQNQIITLLKGKKLAGCKYNIILF